MKIQELRIEESWTTQKQTIPNFPFIWAKSTPVIIIIYNDK
jgi:hypothetical protein